MKKQYKFIFKVIMQNNWCNAAYNLKNVLLKKSHIIGMTTFYELSTQQSGILFMARAFLKSYVEIPPDLEPTEYFIIIIIAAPPRLWCMVKKMMRL